MIHLRPWPLPRGRRAAALIGGLMLAAVPLAAGPGGAAPASAGTVPDISISSVPTQVWTAGESIPEVTVTATAADGDLINFAGFSTSGLPGGLELANPNPTTNSTSTAQAILEGTPNAAVNGTSGTGVISVVDGGGDTNKTSFCWAVSDPGGCPSNGGGGGDQVTVQPIADQTFTAGQPVSINIAASSSDGGSLGYAATGLPPGLSIPNGKNGAHLITGTPQTALTPAPDGTFTGSGTAVITVNDPNDITASTQFNWTVLPSFRTVFVSGGKVHLLGGGTLPEPVMAGTSPAVTAVSGGGFQAAYHGANGDLWFAGTGRHARNGDSGVLISAGSSPAISALPDGGYETAANDGASLYLVGAPGTSDFSGPINGIPIAPGTSPAVAGLANGGWQAAVNLDANNGNDLYLEGSGAPGTLTENTGVAAAAGSSPAITTTTTGWESVINDGASLYLVGTDFSGPVNGIPAAPGTSPAIAGPSGGGWQAAVHLDGNNGNHLYLEGSGAPGTRTGDTGVAVNTGTSPAITATSGGGWEVAFNSGNLYDIGADGAFNPSGAPAVPVDPGTSPALDNQGGPPLF